MPGLLLELLLGFGIGLSLGLLGGGGSILTVPALVYLVGQAPHAAVTTSLAIVGVNSALGALAHARRGGTRWGAVLLFGGAGMVVSFLAAGLSDLFSPVVLMAAFGALMLLVGGLMLAQPEAPEARPAPHWPEVIAGGVGVGLLTGILGVGGGFLIVPALVLLVGLPMTEAVGASLLIIAANSFAGLAGRIGAGGLDWALTAVFVAAGLAGSLLGARLAGRLPSRRLRQLFAVFVIVLGLFLLAENLSRL